VLADRTRLHRSEGSWLPAPRESWRGGLLFSTTGSSASRNHRLWRDDGQRWLGAPAAERLVLLRTSRDRGVRSRFTPLPTAENAAGEGALPGRALDQGPSQDRAEHVPRETRVTRGPAEALAASSNAASTDASRKSNDPLGARVRGSVADVEMTHLPPGARPAERQAAIRGVASCGGLLGDDEGPIRSGRKGAGLERANRIVSAREPAFTARRRIKSTEGVLVRIASSP